MLSSMYQLLFSSNTANIACCSPSAFFWKTINTAVTFFEQRHVLRTQSYYLSFLLHKQYNLHQSCGEGDPRAKKKGVGGQDFKVTILLLQPACGGALSKPLALLISRWYMTGLSVKGQAWFDLSTSFWHFFLPSDAQVFAKQDFNRLQRGPLSQSKNKFTVDQIILFEQNLSLKGC